MKVTFDFSDLKKLKKELSQKAYARVGILSGGDQAQIGRIHEFGASWLTTLKQRRWWRVNVGEVRAPTRITIPERSFLRLPWAKRSRDWLSTTVTAVRQSPFPKPIEIVTKMAVVYLALVKEAFYTQGFGSWKPIHPVTAKLRGGEGPPLLVTQQLARSIDFEVKG